MREQLIQYVELLFAGAKDCEDVKQEILQNTLDRYDDLISEGKVPEAAYRLAITGIGDINEILGTSPQPVSVYHAPAQELPIDDDTPTKKRMRAIAVGLYILCPLPLIVMDEFLDMDVLGLCGTLALVAVATVLMILGAKKKGKQTAAERYEEEEEQHKSPLSKSIASLIWALGLALYFIISFTTNAWHITWVLFPILSALDKLSGIIIQNREALSSDIRFPSKTKLRKSINRVIWAIGLAVYFLISFASGAWFITWLMFPIIGAVQGLVGALLDLKEAVNYEA